MKIKIFTFLFILVFLVPANAYFLQDSKVTTTGKVVIDKHVYDENRAIKLHIHGEGVYNSKQKIYGDENKMEYEEDTVASKQGSIPWTDDLCLKNYEMVSAIRERYTYSEFIDKNTIALMTGNETHVETISGFKGMGYFALKSFKIGYVNAYEYYVGSFDVEKLVHIEILNKSDDFNCP